MSARGAIELVVAKIGLDLGILDTELFSCIVLMAIVTSFLAPLLVKTIQGKIPFTDAERQRVQPIPETFLPSSGLKILIPAAGGSNAPVACHVADVLCGEEGNSATAIYVDTERRVLGERLAFWRKTPKLDIDEYFAGIVAASKTPRGLLFTRRLASNRNVRDTILEEARNDYDFLFLGASDHQHPIYNPRVSGVAGASPCHVVIVRGPLSGKRPSFPFRRILVPTNGSRHADAAFEFASNYAWRVNAGVAMVFFVQSTDQNPLIPSSATDQAEMRAHQTMLENLHRRLPGRMRRQRTEVRVLEGNSLITSISEETLSGEYDLIVLGAENRGIAERIYYGPLVEACLERLQCTVAVVVPSRSLGRRNP
jgi:nucleotide-binding universal stress UspA family protein